MRRRFLAVLAVAAVAAAGAGWGLLRGGDGAAAGDATDAVAGPSPAASAARAEPPREPARALPDRPLRVLVLGDSVMFDAAPAITSALRAAGAEVRAEPYLGMGLARTDLYDWRREWPALLAVFRPDVTIVLLGAWDMPGGATGRAAAVPAGWDRGYRSAVREAVGLLRGDGRTVVWAGFPSVREVAAPEQVAALNAVYAGVAGATPGAAFVDTAGVLAGPDGGFAESVAGPGGRRDRLRKADGVHLCPDGAARLAGALVSAVRSQWQLPAAPGWEHGDWRADDRYGPDAGCPA